MISKEIWVAKYYRFLWESQSNCVSLKCTVDLAEVLARLRLFLILDSFDMWAELYLNLQPSGSALIPFSIEYRLAWQV